MKIIKREENTKQQEDTRHDATCEREALNSTLEKLPEKEKKIKSSVEGIYIFFLRTSRNINSCYLTQRARRFIHIYLLLYFHNWLVTATRAAQERAHQQHTIVGPVLFCVRVSASCISQVSVTHADTKTTSLGIKSFYIYTLFFKFNIRRVFFCRNLITHLKLGSNRALTPFLK